MTACWRSARGLNALALGDDLAAGLGRARRARPGSLVGAGRGPALRRGHRGRRADRVRRAGRAARRRPSSASTTVAAALLGAGRRGAAAVRADVVGRVVARPAEVEVGIITALVGAPFFICVVRRQKDGSAVTRRPGRRSSPRARAAIERVVARRPARAGPAPAPASSVVLVGPGRRGVRASAVLLGDFTVPVRGASGSSSATTVPARPSPSAAAAAPRRARACSSASPSGWPARTFQTMLRNPLASPDVIGISPGRSAAAVFAIVVSRTSTGPRCLGRCHRREPLVDRRARSTVLAYRRGVVGYRLILIGIGIAAMLDSVVAYLFIRAAELGRPAGAALADRQPQRRRLGARARPRSVAAACSCRRSSGLARPLRRDAARRRRRHRPRRARASARAAPRCSRVVLTAFATAAAGPIAFVAFVAAPDRRPRRRRAHARWSAPPSSARCWCWSPTSVAADARSATPLPVGVVTGVLGAPYLVYLLVRGTRRTG